MSHRYSTKNHIPSAISQDVKYYLKIVSKNHKVKYK